MGPHDFLFQTFVYLFAAVTSVPLAKRLGLGSVLGYLIAGVIIGPNVLKLVGEEKEGVMHVAEFGVVMMLFLVGLELRPNLLWKLRGPILGTGGLQVVGTAFVTAVVGILCGLPPNVAVAVGLIASASSTAIAVQSLAERGQLQTKAGQTSFSVLLFQDLSVIPILAVLPLLAGRGASQADLSTGGPPPWVHALVVVATVAIIVVGGRFLIRPVFRYLALTRLHEVFTAAALLLVVGTALAMSRVGLSPALGTFLAGVVLAESEYRHELESDIEPFKGLLLGLFFISVGASIDLNLLRAEPVLVLGLVAGLLVLKFGVLLGIGKVTRLEKSQGFTFAFALAQGGEFAFVLVSFAVQNLVFGERIGNLLVATVALSMVVAPFLFTINEKLVQPRFLSRLPTRDADEIDEKNPVIVAGAGRFGVIVSRMLNVQGFRATVLDFDAEQVELIRRLGFKVFYGDASRLELLESAGAAHAKLLVVAIGDPEKTLTLVSLAKTHFPHLRLLVRAHDREVAYKLIKMGVTDPYRETLDTSLEMSISALRILGFGGYRARRAAQTFRAYDENTVQELAQVYGVPRDEFIGEARKRVHSLDDVFESERAGNALPTDAGWDPPLAAARRTDGASPLPASPAS